MTALIIDCAIAGGWSFRDPWTHPRQGRAVRLAYQCLSPAGAFETGVLILEPPADMVVTGENTERGGVTLDGLRSEGQPAEVLRAAPFWNRLAEASLIVTFCQPFQVGALNLFARAVGLDLSDFPRPRSADAMVRATPIARVAWPEGRNQHGRDPWKSPSLEEAHDRIVGGSLAAKRAEAMASAGPVQAFGLVQVRAVSEVFQATARRAAA